MADTSRRIPLWAVALVGGMGVLTILGLFIYGSYSGLEVTDSVILGLSKNKELFGAPLCPCRYYDDKSDEISLAYWNCPCVPMRERKECHCMLFLTPTNEFASSRQIFEA
eukprot:gene44-48_t